MLSTSAIDVIGLLVLLIILIVGAVVACTLAVGIWQGVRRSSHWQRASEDAEKRRSWVASVRRQAEAAARDGGTREFR